MMKNSKLTLKYLRELAGYSQRELASLANVSPATINYVEQNKRSIRTKHAIKIICILNNRYKDLGYKIDLLTVNDIAWNVYKISNNSLENLVQYQQLKKQNKK
jgi:DNA-binding XRE family transcriptional regulator